MNKSILTTLIFFGIPFISYASIDPGNQAITCPHGYTCTPISVASTTGQFEKIFYMSSAYATSSLNDLQTNVSTGDIIAPQMYTVDANLEATGSIPTQIIDIAKTRGIKIMPLITNNSFSQTLIHDLLASTTAQDSVISYLISEAQNEGYIGWQFDFEHMVATDSEPFSTFVEKSATALHSHNLILSVATIMRVNDDASTNFYKNWSGAFDYAQIAKSSDFISIMTYDDPDSVGPTASIIYDENVLKYLYDKVPPDKISLGIPFFYYGWDETYPPGEIVRYAGAYSRLQYVKLNYEPQEYYSDILGSPYLTYQLDGHQYVSFFDNAKSIQAKLDLVSSRHLRGFSAWVLGMENPDVWNAINE